jgi:hypothetical protein
MACNNSNLIGSQKHRLSSRYITRQMQALGNSVTVVEVIRTFASSAYREETETYVNHTGIYCFVNILTEMDTSVQEGEARAGDLEFNFDISMEPYIKWMNRIIYDGQTFQISDVRKINAIGNTGLIIGCLTKKYSDGTAWNTTLTQDIKLTATKNNPNFTNLTENVKLTATPTTSVT